MIIITWSDKKNPNIYSSIEIVSFCLDQWTLYSFSWTVSRPSFFATRSYRARADAYQEEIVWFRKKLKKDRGWEYTKLRDVDVVDCISNLKGKCNGFFHSFFFCLGVCPGYCPLKQCCHIIPLPAFNGLTFLLDCYICISMHNTVLYKRCHYCYSTLYRYIYEYYTLFHARAVCTQQSALSVTLPFNISEASAWASIIRMCFNTNG